MVRYTEEEKEKFRSRVVSDELRKFLSESGKKRVDSRRKAVVQISLSGELLNIFYSSNHAIKTLGYYISISDTCRGVLKQNGGFRWKYIYQLTQEELEIVKTFKNYSLCQIPVSVQENS